MQNVRHIMWWICCLAVVVVGGGWLCRGVAECVAVEGDTLTELCAREDSPVSDWEREVDSVEALAYGTIDGEEDASGACDEVIEADYREHDWRLNAHICRTSLHLARGVGRIAQASMRMPQRGGVVRWEYLLKRIFNNRVSALEDLRAEESLVETPIPCAVVRVADFYVYALRRLII